MHHHQGGASKRPCCEWSNSSDYRKQVWRTSSLAARGTWFASSIHGYPLKAKQGKDSGWWTWVCRGTCCCHGGPFHSHLSEPLLIPPHPAQNLSPPSFCFLPLPLSPTLSHSSSWTRSHIYSHLTTSPFLPTFSSIMPLCPLPSPFQPPPCLFPATIFSALPFKGTQIFFKPPNVAWFP